MRFYRGKEADWLGAPSRVWNATWWEYRLLLLAGFGVALASLGWEYHRSRTIQRVVGGLLMRDSVAQVKRGYTDVIVALSEAVGRLKEESGTRLDPQYVSASLRVLLIWEHQMPGHLSGSGESAAGVPCPAGRRATSE